MINLQHDVVSLLYSIKGRIETHFCRFESVGSGHEETALPDAHAALRKVYDQTQKALDMTKRIGAVMKEVPQKTISAEVSSIRKSWDHALGCIRSTYPSRQIEYLEHIPDHFPDVSCCQDELIEMMYCVADNAFQAMNGCGRLIVRANLGHTAGNVPTAVITIADTGPGISAEVLGTLFAPFVTTKLPGHGNGLGLCLAQGLARRNGGDVSIASFEGFGTTVTFTLPVAVKIGITGPGVR